jgi:hypothetical protein
MRILSGLSKIRTILFGAIALLAVACNSDYNILRSTENIVLTVDSSTKLTGETMTFTVTSNAGENLTDESEFFVDGAPISGNTYSSSDVGVHVVTAKYFTVTSDPINITFHDGSQINFVKRLLIEDYTGTWCGYCPRVAHAIELVHNLTDAYVPVAIHRASSSPENATYDPYNYDTTVLEDQINVPGYPKGMLNRMTQWNYPEPNNVNQAIGFTQGDNPKMGLAMQATVSNGSIDLTVKAKCAKDFNNVKLVVYVLENGLIYDQHNYTTYFGGEDILHDYTHNHVLRGCLTSLLGDSVSDGEVQLGQTFSRTFNVAIPATVANGSNIEFVAFMLGPDNSVINVRKAAPGDDQGFEEL